MEFVFISILVVFLLVFTTRRKTNNISSGKRGELRVSFILSQLPKEYHVFNDVYLDVHGHSSQIDHVVVSQYGVFVIETKNYSGAVYGSENAEYWTQYLNGNSYEFRNPIKQNQSHVLAVKDTLHIALPSITPIVVFLNGTDLHCSTNNAVIYTGQLLDFILKYRKIEFTSDGVERLSQKLSLSMITDSDREQKHIYSVKRSIKERESKIANRVCPYCNGKLVIRQGKYGRFLGCSNYPCCKFTSQI